MIVSQQQVVIGVLSSLGVAYIYALIIVGWMSEKPSAEAFGFLPLWMVAATSWFVVPTGVLLGLLLQLCAIPRSKVAATLAGVVIGVAAGVFVATITVVWEQWPTLFDEGVVVPDRQIWWQYFWGRWCWYAVTITPLCAVWAGVWSWLLTTASRPFPTPAPPRIR